MERRVASMQGLLKRKGKDEVLLRISDIVVGFANEAEKGWGDGTFS